MAKAVVLELDKIGIEFQDGRTETRSMKAMPVTVPRGEIRIAKNLATEGAKVIVFRYKSGRIYARTAKGAKANTAMSRYLAQKLS